MIKSNAQKVHQDFEYAKENPIKVLVVDDESYVRKMLSHIMTIKSYECHEADGSEKARNLLTKHTFDLVISDVSMPGESGIELARYVIAAYPNTALMMISGADDPGVVNTALEIGAYGYMVKPINASELMINVSSALRRRALEMESRRRQDDLEKQVQERTEELQLTMADLHKNRDATIQVMGATVEIRDPYTAGHQRRVASLACEIAKEMGLSEKVIKGIEMGGVIHDIGKIAVPAEILSKPGRINEYEFGLIKMHTQVGYDLLKMIEFPWPVAQMIYQHHEREDGSGYPCKLSNENILMEAKVLAVADVVEAMSSHRPYRPALGMDVAMDEILKNRERLYDPVVVDACKTVIQDKNFIFEKQA